MFTGSSLDVPYRGRPPLVSSCRPVAKRRGTPTRRDTEINIIQGGQRSPFTAIFAGRSCPLDTTPCSQIPITKRQTGTMTQKPASRTWLIDHPREPIDNVDDFVAIMSRRPTSRARAMSVIAALLAGVTDEGTRCLEKLHDLPGNPFFVKIPHVILHDECTMSDEGAFFLRARVPLRIACIHHDHSESRNVSDLFGLLDVQYGGAVESSWRYSSLHLRKMAYHVCCHDPRTTSLLKGEYSLSGPLTHISTRLLTRMAK